LADEYDDIDYFPGYEIVMSQKNAGQYYDPNFRTVSQKGVQQAISVFLEGHDLEVKRKAEKQKVTRAEEIKRRRERRRKRLALQPTSKQQDLVCEEELLEMFAR
jgi:hypothetical protein